MKAILVIFFVLTGLEKSAAQIQDSSVWQEILQSKKMMSVTNAHFDGEGWNMISHDLKNYQFVLLGEDHGVEEISFFTKELTSLYHPDIYVAEMEPYTVPILISSFQFSEDSLKQFVRKYPLALSFYGLRDYYDIVKHLYNKGCKIWGLDQILASNTSVLFREMERSVKSNKAKRRLADEMAKADQADFHALEMGRLDSLYMMTRDSAYIPDLKEYFRGEDPEFMVLLNDYDKSRRIYQGKTAPFSGHEYRINLMKQNLTKYLLPYLETGGLPERMFFRFGANHMAKGESFLAKFDLGNYVSNLQDLYNKKGLNILIIAASGKRNGIIPIASMQTLDVGPSIPGYEFEKSLRPLLDNTDSSQWMVYDLSPVRKKINAQKIKVDDLNLRRTIIGFDYLVIIPVAHPDKRIEMNF